MEIYIGKDGAQLGPFTADELYRAVRSGEVATTDLAWSHGEANWSPVQEYAAKFSIALPDQRGLVSGPKSAIGRSPDGEFSGSASQLCCPKCESRNVQAISIIIKSGIRSVELDTSAVGVGTGGVIGSRSTTTGTSKTRLAEELSAPEEPAFSRVFVVSLVTFPLWMIPAGMLWMPFTKILNANTLDGLAAVTTIFLSILSGVYYYKRIFRPRKTAWQNALAEWREMYKRGFFCHKCGCKFLG